jgi:NDP-sugar pyrophosphorylase family protein
MLDEGGRVCDGTDGYWIDIGTPDTYRRRTPT